MLALRIDQVVRGIAIQTGRRGKTQSSLCQILVHQEARHQRQPEPGDGCLDDMGELLEAQPAVGMRMRDTRCREPVLPGLLAPASVSTSRFAARWNNLVPTASSRDWIWRLIALCVKWSSSAALVKLSRRAAASNACRAVSEGIERRVIGIPGAHALPHDRNLRKRAS